MRARVTYVVQRPEGSAARRVFHKEYRHIHGGLAAFFKLVEQMRSAIAQKKNTLKSITLTIEVDE